MTEKTKKIELVALIPNGEYRFHAESFKALFSNGRLGVNSQMDGYLPDVKMVTKMNADIDNGIAQLDREKAELIKAKELLATITPIESYAKLEEELRVRKIKMK